MHLHFWDDLVADTVDRIEHELCVVARIIEPADEVNVRVQARIYRFDLTWSVIAHLLSKY